MLSLAMKLGLLTPLYVAPHHLPPPPPSPTAQVVVGSPFAPVRQTPGPVDAPSARPGYYDHDHHNNHDARSESFPHFLYGIRVRGNDACAQRRDVRRRST